MADRAGNQADRNRWIELEQFWLRQETKASQTSSANV